MQSLGDRPKAPLFRGAFLIAATALWAGFLAQGDAHAQGTPACSPGTTTASMVACEQNRYTQSTKDLQAVLSQLQRQLSPAARRQLAQAQAAWVQYRKTNAAFEASTEQGGTLAPLLQITTQAEMTAQRAAELKKHLR